MYVNLNVLHTLSSGRNTFSYFDSNCMQERTGVHFANRVVERAGALVYGARLEETWDRVLYSETPTT